MMRIGLALAGGGARGIAHIGILQELEAAGITIDRLSGTSAGAIIAAMYASRPDAAWVERRFRDFLDSAAFQALGTERLARRQSGDESLSPFGRRIKDHFAVNLSLMRQHFIPREVLNNAVQFLVPARRFEDLERPLDVVATDLQRCRPVVYRSGDLVHALSNSASIPGVLEAEISPEHVIVDGGVLVPVPVECLRGEVDCIVASEISRRGLPPLESINIYALMMRSEQLSQMALAQHQAALADFTFCPDVMSLHWSQFGEFDELLANGRAEGRRRMAALQAELRRRKNPWRRAARRLRQLLDVGIQSRSGDR